MHLNEIVVGVVKRDRRLEVLHLLGKGVRESGHPAAVHPQGMVLFFNVARGDKIGDGFAKHGVLIHPDNFWLRIVALLLKLRAGIDLHN